MSPKASSDFGLYREKEKANNFKSIKFVLVFVSVVLFVFLILYGLLHLVNSGSQAENSFESAIEKPMPRTEKLVLSQSVKREIFQSTPPQPFGVTYRGEPPAEFTPTTEKMTTVYYPQHRYYPNNIQDVIGYANQFYRPIEETADVSVKYPKRFKQSPTQYVRQNKQSRNFTHDYDPFYSFKPEDPGDINLLATQSFRFAPPPWKRFKAQLHSNQQRYPENTKRQGVHNYVKPVTLNLNVFPNKEIEIRGQPSLKQFLNHQIQSLQSRIRFPDSKPKKMVILLNLYPHDANGDESKFVTNIHDAQTTLSPT